MTVDEPDKEEKSDKEIPKVIITGTPKGTNYFHDLYVDSGPGKPNDFNNFRAVWGDNPTDETKK